MTSEQIQMGSQSNEIIPCAKCTTEINMGDAYTFKGADKEEVYICKDCIKDINKEYEQETSNPNFAGAFVLGLLGGLVGAFIWYLVVIITKMEIGYMAIGLGYLVGFAVYLGSGKKRGFPLQLISVALTLTSLIAAELLIFAYFGAQQAEMQGKEIELVIKMLTGGAPTLWPVFFKSLLSPMGLVIYGIGLYVAFGVPKARKI